MGLCCSVWQPANVFCVVYCYLFHCLTWQINSLSLCVTPAHLILCLSNWFSEYVYNTTASILLISVLFKVQLSHLYVSTENMGVSLLLVSDFKCCQNTSFSHCNPCFHSLFTTPIIYYYAAQILVLFKLFRAYFSLHFWVSHFLQL